MDEPAVVVVETPPSEQMEVAQGEIVAEAAVEIAQIAADRDVEIATINADSTAAVVEAQTEIAVAETERHEEWRTAHETHAAILSEMQARQMEHETQISNLTETVTMQAAALAALTPIPPSPPAEEPASEDPAAPEEAGHETEAETRRRRRVWM